MYPLTRHIRRASPALSRQLATVVTTKRKPKEEGTITSVFTTLTPNEDRAALPDRFAALKKEIFRDELVESWRQVLSELESTVGEIVEKGNRVSLVSVTLWTYVDTGVYSHCS